MGRTDEVIALGLAANPPPLRILSLAFGLKGELESALSWAQRHVADSPSNYLAWVELANVLGQLGRVDEANDTFGRARDITPTLTPALYEKDIRLVWPGRDEIVGSLVSGLAELRPD